MAFSLISSTIKQSTDSNTATSSAINTTGSNLIIVSVVDYSSSSAAVLSDSQSNSWTPLTTKTDFSTRIKFYYCYSPTTNGTHTFTLSGNGTYVAFTVLAFSGANTSPFDVENGSNSSPTSSLSTGLVSPSLDAELIITSIGIAAAGQPTSLSINSGFSINNQAVNVSGKSFGIGTAYLIQTTKSGVNPTWSWDTNSESVTVIATFKSAPTIAGSSKFFQLF